MNITDITYPLLQKIIDIRSDAKGVRLDVYVKDFEEVVYDVEMQTVIHPYLEKRSRYYQGMIDIDNLTKGKGYESLKRSYIIFICTEKIFKTDYSFMSFKPQCLEHSDILFDAEMTWVYISTKGNRDGLSNEMCDLLDYIETKK